MTFRVRLALGVWEPLVVPWCSWNLNVDSTLHDYNNIKILYYALHFRIIFSFLSYLENRVGLLIPLWSQVRSITTFSIIKYISSTIWKRCYTYNQMQFLWAEMLGMYQDQHRNFFSSETKSILHYTQNFVSIRLVAIAFNF